MSKLYKQYLILKEANPDTTILFKSGIFYIAIGEDAKLLSDKLMLKLTNLNTEIVKCGFPISRINYYTHLLDSLCIKYLLVDINSPISTSSSHNIELNEVVSYILQLDFNSISYKDAFDILQRIQTMLSKIHK